MFSNFNVPKFNLNTILGGLSRALNVADKVIPIYKQAKPMLSNGKKIIDKFKDYSTNTNKNIKQNINKQKENDYLNRPVFFS